MTVDLAPVMTEPEARRITERIRIALDRVATSWADLADRIGEAYSRRADLALGYDSWESYAAAELKPSAGIGAEVRRELVGLLSARGMSTRAIAPTVGAPRETVRRDALKVTHFGSPEPERIDPVTGEIMPAPTFPATDVSGWETQEIDDQMAADDREIEAWKDSTVPAPITGLDGKTYARTPAPTADRRRPITDAFWEVAYDLNKKVESLQRLVTDDRFKSNAPAISGRNYAQLQQTASTLSEVLAALENHNEESTK